MLGFPVILLWIAGRARADYRSAAWPRMGASIALLLATPIPSVHLAAMLFQYRSDDSTPWEGYSAAMVSVAAAAIWFTRVNRDGPTLP